MAFSQGRMDIILNEANFTDMNTTSKRFQI